VLVRETVRDRYSTHARALAVLRVVIGIFFLFEGVGKLAWLRNPELLTERFSRYVVSATTLNEWYLDLVMPQAAVFAPLVTLGELSAGVALIAGLWSRLAAALTFGMVMNFHVASGALFTPAFLTNGYALPVLGSLLALAMAGTGLPWSVASMRSTRDVAETVQMPDGKVSNDVGGSAARQR
jgi:uncharacterized membrane protein YphA (DoxX/SURF4 family)